MTKLGRWSLPMWKRILANGPTTRLGRWCTPDYAATCSPELKADLTSRDNSFETNDMKFTEKKVEREPPCPWSEPTLFVVLYSYGR